MEVSDELLDDIMKSLLTSKYNQIVPKHDDLFLKDCHDYIENYSTEEQE